MSTIRMSPETMKFIASELDTRGEYYLDWIMDDDDEDIAARCFQTAGYLYNQAKEIESYVSPWQDLIELIRVVWRARSGVQLRFSRD